MQTACQQRREHDASTISPCRGRRTGAVAEILGVPEHRLANLIRHRLIEAPPLVAGRRVWRQSDVEAARRVLVARGAIPSMTEGEPRWEPGQIVAGLDPADLAQDLAAEQEHDDEKERRQIARPDAVVRA